MKTWPLQDAKNQFSQVVELAQTEGPQTVTRHGHPVAVRQKDILAVAFHPELTDERSLHRWLLDRAGVLS